MTHKNREKVSKFHFLKCWMFLKFLVIKTLDPDSLEMLDESMNPDPSTTLLTYVQVDNSIKTGSLIESQKRQTPLPLRIFI